MISIIIPTLKEEGYIEDTLKILAQLGEPHEVVVSDGGSKDNTIEIARRYTPKVVVWDKPRRQTFGEAKNMGAALARGEYLVFIDADVHIPEPDQFFKTLLAHFSANPNLVAATVPLRPWKTGTTVWDRFFCGLLNWWYVFSNNVLHYGNASGEFQFIRAEAYRRVGGYREDLPGGEDTDMFNRLSKVGRTISYRDLHVEHSCRRAHKIGWLKLYAMWTWQGTAVLLLNHAAFKEWKVVR